MFDYLYIGIFSDVHMLALMYAGELCYWGWSVSATSKKQSAEALGATTSDSKAKTVDTISSAALSSTSSLPKDENRPAESTESSKDIVTPSSRVVQPTEVTTNNGLELSTNKAPSDNTTNAGKSCSTHSNMDLSMPDSNSGAGLEQTVEALSIQDTGLLASGCSNCASDTALLERQLYSVMERCQGAEAVENWKSRFDPLKRGQELLSKFVEVARGPLKTQGWNYGRAVQLLVAMKKAQH